MAQGQLPKGVGCIIKNIRGYNRNTTDPVSGDPIMFLGADKHLQIMRDNLNPQIVAGSPYANAKPVPQAKGKTMPVTMADGTKRIMPTHGMDEIASYITSSSINWVAVKCADGTSTSKQWDANLVNAMTSSSIDLYGYQLLKVGSGVQQAQAVIDLFTTNSGALHPRGLVIMPAGNQPDSNIADFYADAGSVQTTTDYLNTLIAAQDNDLINLAFIYCPPGGVSNTSTTAMAVHKKFLEFVSSDTAMRAVMPRIYWGAVRKDDPNSTAPEKLRKRVKHFTDSFLSGYLLSTRSLTLIPLGQAQRLEKHSAAKDLSAISEFIKQIKKFKKKANIQVEAFCIYAFDNLSPMDHVELLDASAGLKQKWGTGTSKPNGVYSDGVVEPSVLADTSQLFPIIRSLVLFKGDGTDVNDCLPTEK